MSDGRPGLAKVVEPCHFAGLDSRPSFRTFARTDTRPYAQRRVPTATLVVQRVGTFFGVATSNIIGKMRYKNIATARHVAMFICRSYGASFPEIGRAFDCDHTTVMSGVRKVKDDERLRAQAELIRQKIEAG